MKSALVTLLPLAAAWPQVMEMMQREAMVPRDPNPGVIPPPRSPLFLSNRPNTGAAHNPPAPFQSDQIVNVGPGSGHEFKPPGKNDLRGECPGLNAAANHGFLPRNGLPTIANTVTGLAEAYNMSPELALFLATVSVALAGDPIKQTWSIGGAFPNTLPFPATGILGTHNQYEGDASIIRGDAYLNGGNVEPQVEVGNPLYGVVVVVVPVAARNLIAMGDSYTLDNAAAQSDYNTRYSILNNPYYFSAPFAGLVAPAAHDFVINFMSNHSAAQPGGYLSRDILQQFFAVTGDKNNFQHNLGQERIPLNWNKRPTLQQYNAADVFADLFVNDAMYPGILRFGGNTGTTNSFVGVELGDFTDGLYNIQTLAQGNNGFCYMIQAASAGLPDASDPIVGLGKSLFDWFAAQLGPLSSKLQCAQLKKINSTPIFQQFPGASYKAQGQSTSWLGGLLKRSPQPFEA